MYAVRTAKYIYNAARANPDTFALGAKVGANAEFLAERAYNYLSHKSQRRKLRMGKRKYSSSKALARKRQKFSSPPIVKYRPNIEVKQVTFGLPTNCGAAAALYTRDLTAILQDTHAYDRIGNKVSVLGVDIHLSLGSNPALCGLTLCSSTFGDVPAASDFNTEWTSPIRPEFGKSFWHQIGGDPMSIAVVNKKYRFKYPLTVMYDDTNSEALKNRLFMCFYHGVTSSSNMGGSFTVYFTDD